MARLPFEGIRVADFGWVITAPLATLWLATLGAEVIKIENKAHPDTMRRIRGAGGVALMDPLKLNQSPSFNSLNYSKYSCCLELSHPKAQELAREIVKISDVVVEAYTYPVVERFGLTYEDIKAVKPDIVMLSVSSLGKTGPLRDTTGYGPSNQAYAGLPSMTGYEGSIGGNIGGTWPDYWMGVAAAYLLMSGLYHKRRTGRGIYMDLSMVEAVLNMVPGQILDYQMNGRAAQPWGNWDPLSAPHGVYRCLGDDRWVAIAVEDETQWAAFCQASGHLEWQHDERFADAYLRQQRRSELDALVTEWTREHTAQDITALLQGVGVSAGPSNDSLGLVNDPQLRHRQQFVGLDHAEMGSREYMAMQGIFSAIPERRYAPTPVYDRDNHGVFRDLLGLPEAEIDDLIKEGVIA